jgi:pSer/pThr/pTyr-binding forkhead associated (FHA) protein
MENDKGQDPISSNLRREEVKDSCVRSAVLICEKIQGESPFYNLPNNKEFFIGTNPDNDLCLKGDSISDVQAKIRPEKNNYVLHNLQTKNEVTVNWVKTVKRALEHKDRIKIGSYNLIFEFVKENGVFSASKSVAKLDMAMKFLVNTGSGMEEVSATVKDIGLNGAWIETEKELKKGIVIEVGIFSDKLPIIEVMAQVIWEKIQEKEGKMSYNIGLQFLEIDEKARNALKDYLDEQIS